MLGIRRIGGLGLLVLTLSLTEPASAGSEFIRGDANVDGQINLVDPLFILNFLFNSGPAPCLDAMDINDIDDINIADALVLLNFMFTSGPPPAPPFPDCGADPTADSLDCLDATPACPTTTPGCSPIENRCNQLPAQPSGVQPLAPDGKPVPQAPSYYAPGVPVGLLNGELRLQRTDLMSPSVGFGFAFTRTYTSRSSFDGALGHNWTFNLDRRVVEVGASCWIADGHGREDEFFETGAGVFHSVSVFTDLIKNPNGTFTEVLADGFTYLYDTDGRLVGMIDRNGNVQTIERNAFGNIVRVIDTQDRLYTFTYTDGTAANDFSDGTADQKIASVSDYLGRTVEFTRDAHGNLTAVRSPIVVGTPTGNDFPQGKTTLYTYLFGTGDPLLDHNLTSEIQPAYNVANDPAQSTPCFEVTYDATTDRVDSCRWGNDNGGPPSAPALVVGGTFTYEHEDDLTTDPQAPASAVHRVRVIDPNGNQVDHYFDDTDHEILTIEHTNRDVRPGEGDYQTKYQYDNEGCLTGITLPRGNEILYTYDKTNPDQRGRGNLLETRRSAGSLGGGVPDLVTRFTYEPLFNRLYTTTDGRAFPTGVVPLNGNGHLDLTDPSVGRFTTCRMYDYQETTGDQAAAGVPADRQVPEGLGDLNGAADFAEGNVVRIVYPEIQTPGPNLGDILIETHQHNDEGQPTQHTNGAGQTVSYQYFPSNGTPLDASDTEGFLASVTVDPGGLNLTTSFTCDAAGNQIAMTDPKGQVQLQQFNALNQLVKIDSRKWSTTGTGHSTCFSYDANDNRTTVTIDNLDETGTPYPNAQITTSWNHNILNATISIERDKTRNDGSSPGTVEQFIRHDTNLNPIEVIKPAGNSVFQSYDERNLPYQKTTGSDPATAIIETCNYDPNRNLSECIDHEADAVSASSPTTAFPGSGNGDVTRCEYDCHDRWSQTIDPEGTTYSCEYDEASQWTGIEAVGVPDAAGSPATPLAETTRVLDEIGRVTQWNRTHSDVQTSAGIGDGVSTTEFGYNGAHQQTSVTNDNGNTTTFTFDAAGRLECRTDAAGNKIENTYDANSNLIQETHTESSTSLGSPPDVYVFMNVYDAVDRCIQRVDAAGSFVDVFFDSLSNVVKTSDPLRGAANTGPGNIVRHHFDALQRLVKREEDLTASGRGDTPVVSTLVTEWLWNDNSKLIEHQDANGNRSCVDYDDRDLMTCTTLANGSTYSCVHDQDGKQVQRTDANGTVISLTHDGKNQLLQEDAVLAPGVVGPASRSLDWDGVGRCVQAIYGASTVILGWDSLSNCTTDNQNGLAVSKTFDGVGNCTSLKHPGGFTESSTFDVLERLIVKSFGLGIEVQHDYKGPERVEETRYVQGGVTHSTTSIDYEVRGLAFRITLRNGAGAIFDQREYGLDRRGDVQFENVVTNGNTGSVYVFDSARRLDCSFHNVDLSTATPGVESVPGSLTSTEGVNYTRDGVANWLQMILSTPGSTQTLDYTIDVSNQMTSQTDGVFPLLFASDANGSMTDDMITQRTFDMQCYMNSISSFGVTFGELGWDGLGRNISADLQGVGVLDQIFDGDRVIQTRNGGTTSEVVWGGAVNNEIMAAILESNTPEFIHTRLDTSPIIVTDGAGNIVATYDFGDYGEQTSATPLPLELGYRGRQSYFGFHILPGGLAVDAFNGRSAQRQFSDRGVQYAAEWGQSVDPGGRVAGIPSDGIMADGFFNTPSLSLRDVLPSTFNMPPRGWDYDGPPLATMGVGISESTATEVPADGSFNPPSLLEWPPRSTNRPPRGWDVDGPLVATHGTGIRAPGIGELFGGRQGSGPIPDPPRCTSLHMLARSGSAAERYISPQHPYSYLNDFAPTPAPSSTGAPRTVGDTRWSISSQTVGDRIWSGLPVTGYTNGRGGDGSNGTPSSAPPFQPTPLDAAGLEASFVDHALRDKGLSAFGSSVLQAWPPPA